MASRSRGFPHSISVNIITVAELNGILTALSIVEYLGVERLILESDSLTVVKLVKLGVYMHHPHVVLINHICAKLCNHVDSYVVRHVFREANCVADYLSKLGHLLPLTPQIFKSPLLDAWFWLPMLIRELISLALSLATFF